MTHSPVCCFCLWHFYPVAPPRGHHTAWKDLLPQSFRSWLVLSLHSFPPVFSPVRVPGSSVRAVARNLHLGPLEVVLDGSEVFLRSFSRCICVQVRQKSIDPAAWWASVIFMFRVLAAPQWKPWLLIVSKALHHLNFANIDCAQP